VRGSREASPKQASTKIGKELKPIDRTEIAKRREASLKDAEHPEINEQ
jgi:hypothetical protein